MKPLLLVLDDWEGLIEKALCRGSLKDVVEIKFLRGSIPGSNDPAIERAEFLIAIRERTSLNKEIFDRMPKLQLVLQTGGHAYHIDTIAAQERNIQIALGRKATAPLVSVPELTFAFMLGLSHRIYQASSALKNGEWKLFTGRTLSNKRLGILGLGRQGSRVAEIASTSFNMDVVAWDRGERHYEKNNGFKRLPLDELLATSDIVSIHLRLSKESTGLMNKEQLAKMKPGALLINTSRGAMVDEGALVDALKEGRIAGAALDVFVREPLPADSSLRVLDNVILTPHIGWTVEEVFEEFAQIACSQLLAYMNGTIPANELLFADGGTTIKRAHRNH